MRKGFTIIEMLVVIVIIGLMVGMSIPYLNAKKWNIHTVENDIKGKIRLARQLSISKESHYGVFFSNNNDTCFVFIDSDKNNAYGAINDNLIDIFELPKGITVWGENSDGNVIDDTNPLIFNVRGMIDKSCNIFVATNEDTIEMFVLISGLVE